MKVDGSLKSLLQGVSQQPMRDRLPGQCTAQLNFTPDPINGLTRRPPTDLVKEILVATGPATFHDFQVKNGNKYIAVIADGGVHVYDLNGNEQIVNGPNSTYLGTNMRMATIDNDTYIVNRTVSPAMFPDTTGYFNTQSFGAGIVTVLGGAYGRTYNILIDGTVVAAYQTPSGAAPANDSIQSSPHYIMGKLIEGLQTNPAFIVSSDGNSSFLIRKSTPFILTVGDDQGGVNMKGVTNYVTKIEDLPAKAVNNYCIRVSSKADPNIDVFYKFVAQDKVTTNPTDGFWQEAVAFGQPYRINEFTMPLLLQYNPANQQFNLNRGVWKDRQVGTIVSNPEPSFIGNPINEVTSFQGRLVFVAGANLIASRTNRPTDFWQASATLLADTDPIDISSKAIQGILLSATPFNKDLVLMTEKAQFVLFGRTVVTPKTAALVQTTNFEATLTARPVPAGRNLFFSTSFGRFSGIREFYTESSVDVNDSRAVTQHVQNYIIGEIQHMAASSNYELLLIQSGNGNKLTCYKYIWADNNKVQSAWHEWEFNAPIKHCFFDQEIVYTIALIGNKYHLYRLSLDQVDTENVGFPLYMDSRFDVLNVYSSFALPYDALNTYNLVVVQGTGCPHPGMKVPIMSKMYIAGTGWVYTLKNNMLGGNILVGVPFRSSYIPNQPQVKDEDGIPIGTAKLVQKNYIVTLSDTGDVTGLVKTKWGDANPVVYRGRVIGDIGNKVGAAAVNDDLFVIPVGEEAQNATTEISTDDVYPLTMLDIEWTGQYNKKGRRIAIGGKQ